MYEFSVLIVRNFYCNIVCFWCIHEPLQTICVMLTKCKSPHGSTVYSRTARHGEAKVSEEADSVNVYVKRDFETRFYNSRKLKYGKNCIYGPGMIFALYGHTSGKAVVKGPLTYYTAYLATLLRVGKHFI